jgi:hypothetical protein
MSRSWTNYSGSNSEDTEVQGRTVVVLLVAGMVLPACTYERTGAPARHYTEFRVAPPTQFNKVEVCHAYTCKQKSPYYFRKPDIAELAALMRKVKRADTPYEERRAMAYAIGRIERDVGKKLGLKDNPGMSFRSSGDSSQQDCVDEATNTTSYLLILESNGLLKHHTVQTPIAKGNLIKGMLKGKPVEYWPHWAAVLLEKKTGQRYAVDSWPFKMGENPGVQKIEDWYIKDRQRSAS